MKFVSKMVRAAFVAFIGASTCWADAPSTHRIPAALAFEAATKTVANTRTRKDLPRPGLAVGNNLAGSSGSFGQSTDRSNPRAAQSLALRTKMETEWTPQMMKALGLQRNSLPIIWDADFLYGPRSAAGEDTYVLCEINVSCVFAIPDEAPAAIARLTLERLRKD